METNNINQDWEHTIWAQSTTNSIFLDQKSHGIAIRLDQFTLFASRPNQFFTTQSSNHKQVYKYQVR